MKLAWPQQRLSGRQLAAIPLALAIFLSSVTLVALASGAFPVSRDFRGGSLIRVSGENLPDIENVEAAVENLLGSDVDVDPIENGLDIRTDNVLDDNGENLVKSMFSGQFGILEDAITIETMGPTITGLYSEQARNALIGAFVAMAVIVFIAFRKRITIGAILLSVALDMLGVLGCMALFGVELSLASIAGFLMLIGYAVDTNVLLTTRVLKRMEDEPRRRVVDAMRTGLMMNCSTLIPIVSLNVITTAPQLSQLTAVLIFGIIIDIFNTWFLNAAILLRHVERQRRKGYHVST
ncbi:MAG: hypothetical protein DRN83_01235 [Hadesarchaea archaeon]|nr:MAG: hypothetical protein DRN83_01235 [Hadesarchaea archaeon]HDI12914.1 hypothetical protein [Hadesarchaea archaeon]